MRLENVVIYDEPRNGVVGYYLSRILEREQYRAQVGNPMVLGTHNGYVIVDKSDWKAGLTYEELDELVEVHGGLTYKDTHHLDELKEMGFKFKKPIVMFGFDTAHAGDTIDNWNKDATLLETMDLALQLEKLEQPK